MSRPKKRVKRPHMVSESYLGAWADSRGIVAVLDFEHGRGFETAIHDATVVRYVYEPSVLTHDLEDEFGRIEAYAAPQIVKLRDGSLLTAREKRWVVEFLDMHLERGRYADQTKIRTPAVLAKTDGTAEDAHLALGDRLLLSRYMDGAVRLSELGVEQWSWQVVDAANLATGDGAVLLYRRSGR